MFALLILLFSYSNGFPLHVPGRRIRMQPSSYCSFRRRGATCTFSALNHPFQQYKSPKNKRSLLQRLRIAGKFPFARIRAEPEELSINEKDEVSSAIITKPAHQPRRRLFLGILMLASCWTIVKTVSTRQSYVGVLDHLFRSALPISKILKLALFSLLVYRVLDVFQTHKRQTRDATSEWIRYAQHPMHRGLALSSVAARVAVVAALGKLFPRYKALAGSIFADGLLRIGPLYIKLGQIVSSQSSKFPSEWEPAMDRLQDRVPAQSGSQAKQLAHAVWPGGIESFERTFTSVDWTPLAAASLGQVHRATIKKSTGEVEKVAIKLQRPFLREIYDKDFTFLTSIAQKVDRFLGKSAGSIGGVQQSWTKIVQNAEEILYREIDYVAEAENGMRFNRDFGLGKGGTPVESPIIARNGSPLDSAAPWLRAPYVYKELSTRKVLVMEFVPSIKVTKSEALSKVGVTAKDKEYLAECLGRSYLRQLCCNKFFSTDPHAGNLGVETLDMTSTLPERRVRLCFYDFGQAAELRQNQADGILEILEAIIDCDVDRSVKAFDQMGVLVDGADLDVVRAKVAENYRTGKIKASRKHQQQSHRSYLDNPAINGATEPASSDSKVMQYFTLPAEYAFVGRALAQMDGVGKSLDPSFDFISAAAPWFYEIKGADKYLKDEAFKKLDMLKSKLLKAIPWHADTGLYSSNGGAILSAEVKEDPSQFVLR